ncbi:MAG: DUF4340 domain-containing protein [Bacillota bacterium]|nr:DUF4340 domain-containing protein [Bacillota bacterium]
MRLKRNIIAAIVAILLCIAAVLVVQLIPNNDTSKTSSEKDKLASGKDTSVTIVNYKKGSYVNSKIIVEGGNFSYTLAKTTKADASVQYIIEDHPTIEVKPESVNILAENYSYVVMADTIKKNCTNLAEYGLDKPQGKYTLVNENGKNTTILIGDKIGTRYYSMVEGQNTVYTIFDSYGDAVLGGINSLRETTLVNIESGKAADQLKQFRIDTRSGCMVNIRVAQEGDIIASSSSKFIMTEPYNMPVYSSKLIELLPAFTPVNVNEFIEDDPKDLSKYGLDNPQYTLTLADGNGTYVIYYGNPTPDGKKVYCMMKGKNFVFCMTKDKLDAFASVDPYILCDRYAHLINIDKVSSVQVVSADGSHNYVMKVDRNTKQLFFINDKPAEDESFRLAYRYIAGIGLSADGGPSAVKEKESLKIIFKFTNGATYTATYYEYDDRNYVLDRNGEKSNFLVAKKSITEMYDKLNSIKTK